jgi:hypothetical protein
VNWTIRQCQKQMKSASQFAHSRCDLPCCSIFHTVHEQNAQNLYYPCACKELLQT